MLFMATLWLGMAVAVLGQDTDYRAINERSTVTPNCQGPRLGYRLGPNVLRCDGALEGRVLATNRVSLQL